ncbi:MAG TPA: hypothetical protein VMN82_11630 [Thermoanaerobaculia bacterium]|nr:hypothetical protein [Thermoanaerobaculia bacterium]
MATRREIANRWIVAAAAAAAALLLALQLLVAPVVGLADNGDYLRVMGPAGFDHTTDVPAERYLSFLRTTYRFLPVGWTGNGYLTSESGLALVARYASPALWRGGLFDLRALSAIHAALLLLALVGILRAARGLPWPAQAVAAVLLVFFFTDVGYVAPLNSFYSQVASLLALLLLAAVALAAARRGRLDGALLAAYFLLAAAFIGSKPQEAAQGLVLALLCWRLAGGASRRAWRQPAAWLAAALVAFSAWYGRSTPDTLRAAALYQVVFYEILPHSPDPAGDAAALGLDPAWLRYSGTDAFQPGTPVLDDAFRTRFLRDSGYGRVALLYARHPRRLAERLHRIAPKVWSLRPSYGNLEKSDAHPALTLTDRYSVWSRWRLRLFRPAAWGWLGALLLGNAAWAAMTWRRATPCGRLARETLLAAVAMTATAYGVCVLTNAPPDFSRVFYVAEALCDLILVADATWLVAALTARGARKPVSSDAA